MARYITQTRDLPPEAVSVAQRIQLLGFGWRYSPEERLADLSRRVQVRDTGALAPSREVAHYAQAMKNGDRMPPVVLTKDGYLVDGATRTEAARRASLDCFHAFRLDVDYEQSGAAIRNQLIILGSAFNLTHGRGMSRENIESVVAAICREDDSPRDVARKLHISESTATAVICGMKARNLAAKLGVQLNGSLSASHLRFLGGKTQKYTHPVFAAFTALVQDARMSMPATTMLAKLVEAAGSEEEKLKIIAEARESSSEMIATGVPHAPSRAGRLRQTLGFLGNQDPELLVETNPARAAEHSRLVDDAIARLQLVKVAQYRLTLARGK